MGGGVIIEEIFDDEEDPYLSFEAELPENENTWPSHVVDTVKQIEMGLIGGISPGFMVPPKEVVPNAEEFLEEPGNPDVLVRQINEAVLVELSSCDTAKLYRNGRKRSSRRCRSRLLKRRVSDMAITILYTDVTWLLN